MADTSGRPEMSVKAIKTKDLEADTIVTAMKICPTKSTNVIGEGCPGFIAEAPIVRTSLCGGG